jgi:hypothetical protein
MVDEDFTFEQAPAEKVVTFFEKPIAEAVQAPLPGPESVDDLAETPLAYKELCEAVLKELHGVTEKRKHFEKYEKELKEEVRRLIGKETGMIQRGAYGVQATEVNAPAKTDYVGALVMIKAWATNLIGDSAKAEIEKMVANNKTPGAKVIKITPYRVGSEPKDE